MREESFRLSKGMIVHKDKHGNVEIFKAPFLFTLEEADIEGKKVHRISMSKETAKKLKQIL